MYNLQFFKFSSKKNLNVNFNYMLYLCCRCRRAIIAEHFGERWESSDCNNMCDHCDKFSPCKFSLVFKENPLYLNLKKFNFRSKKNFYSFIIILCVFYIILTSVFFLKPCLSVLSVDSRKSPFQQSVLNDFAQPMYYRLIYICLHPNDYSSLLNA